MSEPTANEIAAHPQIPTAAVTFVRLGANISGMKSVATHNGT